ncbi:MAG: copper amine oxidase N-terminal domain-containing protein [Eubacteriales bacterium]|nr:copper amine oxidase N-terminal domain-containing protein [Eubacteriales bacterium]
MKRNRSLVIGIIIGMLAMSGGPMLASAAIAKIEAYTNSDMTFTFDGEKKELPSEYEVLVYKDRSYVPVRFIAENLGATVDWNDETKIIALTSAKQEIPQKPEDVDKTIYKALPLFKENSDLKVTADMYGEDSKGDRIWFTVKNKTDAPIQLNQMATKITADGKEYSMDSKRAIDFDKRWYNDLRKDNEVQGFILLPTAIKDPEKMQIELTFITQGTDKSETVSFDIAL